MQLVIEGVVINNIDGEVFREFSREAKRQKLTVSEALTQAMKLWLQERKSSDN